MFEWLAQGIDPVQLPNPVNNYATKMTLQGMARKDRQAGEMESASKDAQQIFADAQSMGWQAAMGKAIQEGKNQGALLAFEYQKKQELEQADLDVKRGTARQHDATAANQAMKAKAEGFKAFSNAVTQIASGSVPVNQQTAGFLYESASQFLPKEIVSQIPATADGIKQFAAQFANPEVLDKLWKNAQEVPARVGKFNADADKARVDATLAPYKAQTGRMSAEAQTSQARTHAAGVGSDIQMAYDLGLNQTPPPRLGVSPAEAPPETAARPPAVMPPGTPPRWGGQSKGQPTAAEADWIRKEGGAAALGEQQPAPSQAQNPDSITSYVAPPGKRSFSDTVDYYADMAMQGDNQWRVGLSRMKAGSQMIMAVDKRMAERASELGMSAGEIIALKQENAGLAKAMLDRTKVVAAASQFVRNFDKQADLVLREAEKGTGPMGVPVIDRWLQAGRKQIAGDPEVSQFDVFIRGLSREHQRIVTGATASIAQMHAMSQQTADELLNIAQSTEQVKAVVSGMREEAHNIIQAGRDEIKDLRGQTSSLIPNATAAKGGTAPAAGKTFPKPTPAAVEYLMNHNDEKTKADFIEMYGKLP